MEAFIFDFDGVIVDSERHWHDLHRSVYPSLMPEFTEQHSKQLMGLSITAEYDYLVAHVGLTLTYDELRKVIDPSIMKIYEERAALLPGFRELLAALETQHTPIAIASSSLRSWIDAVLERTDLSTAFPVICSREDVEEAKPHPDIYVLAAKRLQVDPKSCVALEDSRNGIRSAKTAGMYCIALRTEMNADQDLSEADVAVETLQNVIPLISK